MYSVIDVIDEDDILESNLGYGLEEDMDTIMKSMFEEANTYRSTEGMVTNNEVAERLEYYANLLDMK